MWVYIVILMHCRPHTGTGPAIVGLPVALPTGAGEGANSVCTDLLTVVGTVRTLIYI